MKKISVGIIGLGQIGGSLGMALKGKVRERIGITRNRKSLNFALRFRAVDRGWLSSDKSNLNHLSLCDIIFLCTPVREIISIIPGVGAVMKEDAILTDVGSTKFLILKEMEKLPFSIQYIGGHPMCGSEKSGIAYAKSSLFRESPFILVKDKRATPKTVNTLKKLFF